MTPKKYLTNFIAAALVVLSVGQIDAADIAVDGKFEDWKGSDIKSFTQVGDVQDYAIVNGAVTANNEFLFAKVACKGPISFNGTFYEVFIDADGDKNTGYRVGGIGAELLFENGVLHKYTGGNGSAWAWEATGEAKFSLGEADGNPDSSMELAIPVDLLKPQSKGVAVVFNNFRMVDGHQKSSLGPKGGLLIGIAEKQKAAGSQN